MNLIKLTCGIVGALLCGLGSYALAITGTNLFIVNFHAMTTTAVTAFCGSLMAVVIGYPFLRSAIKD
jgi:hypothetical protein